jgi:biotin transport system substrate-specific component
MARMRLPQALVAIAVLAPGDLLKALATAFVAGASQRSYPPRSPAVCDHSLHHQRNACRDMRAKRWSRQS